MLVQREGEDFFWKSTICDLAETDWEENKLDIHHIFPKKWCEIHGIPSTRYDSILNKTPISYKATRPIGGKAPSEYLNQLQSHESVQLEDAGMDAILVTLHLAKYFPAFRGNDQSPWTEDQWRRLLTEYRICTPAEIGNAVQRCAEEAFYQGRPGQIELEALLGQRQQFTPAMERESEQMQAIRNLATYARPASGSDQGLPMCTESFLNEAIAQSIHQ